MLIGTTDVRFRQTNQTIFSWIFHVCSWTLSSSAPHGLTACLSVNCLVLTSSNLSSANQFRHSAFWFSPTCPSGLHPGLFRLHGNEGRAVITKQNPPRLNCQVASLRGGWTAQSRRPQTSRSSAVQTSTV